MRLMTKASGKILVCPTPIGNLGDITQRVIETLRSADVVCAEDTRVTGKLLSSLGIRTPLARLDEATLEDRASGFMARARAGDTIAYCTDAGMPGVSDPGLRLVAMAREAGVCVEVLPGPSAAATAYVASGTQHRCYYFGGFFPRKVSERRALLESLRPLDAALVFYESPRRLAAALETIAETYPFRLVSVCRELTKLHEEVLRDTAPQIAEEFTRRDREQGIKGEIVIVIDGASQEETRQLRETTCASASQRALELVRAGLRTKDAAREVSRAFGIGRNEAYALAAQAKSTIEEGSQHDASASTPHPSDGAHALEDPLP